MQMDAFFLQEDRLQPQFEQNNECDEEFTQNEVENIFGIQYKENMFEDPSPFDLDLPKQTECEQIQHEADDSCLSEQTTAVPIVQKAVEYPPCRCYRINCQKRYCECFRNGRKCTKNCVCVDCHNQPVVTRIQVNVEQFWEVSYMFNSIKRKC